ncbi:Por secretion system C-terminal sorting domain-containing protein [Tenacibaculum sp. MAR_2010_89]|uniref:T9SS type A sorting domain-containing protein n=1 Tax=Tenacibaculum sp. MAR_2010_89 TaxID=1250198 RepID=UPI000894C071|nr:T9SS type A sorting domain-containing protein [Tenacibaculum sp. MAR_2010_89]SEE60166.1 Por secretion system C-terminal sorting domain-containing protein [Tenacibaculum sp. MAR_2010_89]
MRQLSIYLLTLMIIFSCKLEKKDSVSIPQKHKKEKKEENPDKYAIWTEAQAARHQKILQKLTTSAKKFNHKKGSFTSYANGNLNGSWINRGPKNMPGAFKFAEMLEGTDIIYGVTHNHYAGEFNSKAYIFKGTVYNPKTGKGGDDFTLLTANWPNRYQNLFAFKIGATTRLIAHIENGPLYYSDDEGTTWARSNGLPDANTSSAINRQDNHTIYVTNGQKIYISTDKGINFTLLKDYGSPKKSSFLYTPRFSAQPNSNTVYLARNGSFYQLNNAKTDFTLSGTYINSHGNRQFSIGGDSRVLYITENKNYWVSTDHGKTWTSKSPKGNWYGDRTGKMSPGKFFAVHPENPNISIAGYAQPVISLDKLDTDLSTTSGWGRYQNGTHLKAEDYYNRIRFNYHPDFQASHFFYNSSGDLFSARCSDGGIFISYKEWKSFPNEGTAFDNSGYANAHYINLNVLNTINPLIYRENIFTGANNPNHIYYSTQDQGSGSIISDTNNETLDFYQSIGGDGPPIDSYDGKHAWKWQREGKKVYAPVKIYSNTGSFQSIGKINSLFKEENSVSFTKKSEMGWVQTYIDHADSDKNMWILAQDLNRVTWDGTNITSHIINKGNNHVAALAQATGNPNKLYMLQDSKVFISTDRGTSFNTSADTPFSLTNESWGKGDIGSGVVLPTNDNWILFCGPSTNNVGAILSKDGGQTWIDVTGDFPSGIDAQTGGMVATPNGKFVFAGTDIGPYVFDVTNEKWYSLAEGIGFFNAMDVDYIPAINTVRFASWGSGILDFKIEAKSLGVNDHTLNTLTLFPNPAKDFVTINLESLLINKVTIEVFTLQGKRVIHKKEISFINKKTTLNTSKLVAGIYLITITGENNNKATKKMIIE